MSQTITITHGGKKHISAFTTPLSFFSSNKIAMPVCARANNKLVDLTCDLNEDTMLDAVYFDSDDGKHVFWHSSAHVLGYAILKVFPDALLASGPPTQSGFYYDVKLSRSVTQEDYAALENAANEIIKKGYLFKKDLRTKDELMEFYKFNKYKQHYVNKVEKESTVYVCGDFEDFCQGPHVHSTNTIKHFRITSNASSYFLGKATNDSLQRIYGITFPNKEYLKKYKERMELAKQRDHRKLGTEHGLFFFNEISPGSCFFMPRGAFIYNTLVEFIRAEYKKRDFLEVVTPNMFSTKLWETSGHLVNYKENMFSFTVEDMEFALKPMNCPGHCLIYKAKNKSYREMPLRLADFGVLHRNELSGTLTGLTRVRRFQQDDAHIFCTEDQIEKEIESCIEFVDFIYGIFKFKYEIKLSTRPEKYIGEITKWDEAESKLRQVLDKNKKGYLLNEGDGAFYGPKIDIVLEDALGRKNQCATIQLDFQLPERFDLGYIDSDGVKKRPVMIHRAILGSVERFIAILLESYGIKLPFWISPFQLAIVAVSEDQKDYTEELKKCFNDFNVDVFCDAGVTLAKKIKNAQKYAIIGVVGMQEQEKGEINVRGKGVFKIKQLRDEMERIKSEFGMAFESK